MDLGIPNPPALLCFPKCRGKIGSGALACQGHRLDDRGVVQHRYQIPGIGFARPFRPRGRAKKRDSQHYDDKCALDRSRPTLTGHEQHPPDSVSSPVFVRDSLLRRRTTHKVGEMGETVGLCPKADLARFRECRISSFDDAPLVERDLKNITGNLQG